MQSLRAGWQRYRGRFWMALALLCWLIAVGRFASAAVTNLPPWQDTHFVISTGEDVAFSCAQAIIGDGDIVWRFECIAPALKSTPYSHMIQRTNIPKQAVDQHWVFADNEMDSIALPRGFVPNADGGAAVMFSTYDTASDNDSAMVLRVFRLMPDGTYSRYSDPPANYPVGVDWNSDGAGLDVITWDFDTEKATLTPLSLNDALEQPTIITNDACGAADYCRAEVAYKVNDEWRIVWSRVPRKPANPDVVTMDLLEGGIDGGMKPVASFALDRVTMADDVSKGVYCQRGQYDVYSDSGEFRWVTTGAIDGASGNIIGRGLCGLPVVQQLDGSWVQLPALPETASGSVSAAFVEERSITSENMSDPETLPTFDDSFTTSYYRADGRLHWLPNGTVGFGDMYPYWHGQYGRLVSDHDTLRAIPQQGEVQTILTQTRGDWLYWLGKGLVGQADGTLLWMNSNSDFVRLNADFSRADDVSFTDRLKRALVGNFDSYGSGNSPDYDFYTQDAAQWSKTASVPILLLGLPILLLIAAVRRRWIGAAQLYVLLFIVLITWYWQLLRFF